MKSYVIIFLSSIISVNSETIEDVRKWIRYELPVVEQPYPVYPRNLDLNTHTYLDVQFLESNLNYGWVCGFQSVILKTTDGGQTWEHRFISPNRAIQLESIWFLNENVGYASGPRSWSAINTLQEGFVYKTVDGGDNWFEVSPVSTGLAQNGNIVNFTPNIWGLYFLNENLGWVLGGECNQTINTFDNDNISRFFYKTTDGGRTWEEVTDNRPDIKNTKLSDLIVFPNGQGYAMSSGYIWQTSDFGDSWQLLSSTGNQDWHEDISVLGNSILVPFDGGCSGNSSDELGGLRFSSDNGLTWNSTNLGSDMYGAWLSSETEGWGVGRNGGVYRTTNSGITWEVENYCIDEELIMDDIYFIDQNRAWVVGDGIFSLEISDLVIDTLAPVNVLVCEDFDSNIDFGFDFDIIYWSNGERNNRYLNETITESKTISVTGQNEICADSIISRSFYITYSERPNTDLERLPDLLCEGEEYFVRANGNITDPIWIGPDGFTTRSNTFFTTIPGSYTYTYENNDGCSFFDTLNIEFSPLPDPIILEEDFLDFCIGDTVELTLNNSFSSYTWYEESIGTIDEQAQSLRVGESGTYYVVVASDFGCINESNRIEVNVRRDTNQLDFSELYIDDIFNIDNPLEDQTVCGFLELYNNSWKPLILNNPELSSNIEFSIPASQLPIVINPFSFGTIDICFRSNQIGKRLDSLIIADICSTHIIPLEGEILEIDREGLSRCRLDLFFNAFGNQTAYSVYFGLPFPNPGKDFTKLEFVEFDNIFGEQTSVVGVLLDNLGNVLTQGLVTINEEETRENGIVRYGQIEFNLDGIYSGSYLINLQTRNDIQTFNFTIKK